jgi:hypothetical protein
MAKQTRLFFSLSISKTHSSFELIYSDVWGLTFLISYNRFKYFILLINDFSRTVWLYLLRTKDEIFDYFVEFTNIIKTQYDEKLKYFARIMEPNS